jgi:predicted Zn-dependent protease
MIRVVTVEEQDPVLTLRVCKALHAAYGVGAEHLGTVPMPAGVRVGKEVVASKLLLELDAVKTFADDKLFYLTSEPLASRELATGKLPTPGDAQFGGERALVTSHGLGKGDDLIRRLAKISVHQAGHLWELHHCLDGRCSMFTPWAEQFAVGDPLLCSFCREQSEARINRAHPKR